MKSEDANIIIKMKRNIHHLILRKRIHKRSFTLISQNCVGGVIYHMLDMPFKTPTINLYINDEDFVKLAENPRYYFSIEPEPLLEKYIEPTDEQVNYPLIKVGDITVYCRHYNSCKEAIDSWNRRRERIDYNNIYVIATSWNLHESAELIERIGKCGYPNVIFTYEKYDLPNCVYLKGDKWKKDKRGFVKPAIPNYSKNGYIRNFEELFDFPKWINYGVVEER